jgi:hypothetical protein
MTIALPRERQEWLEAQVKQVDADDLAWARPPVDEARASVARGEGMTLAEYQARMTERFGKLDR